MICELFGRTYGTLFGAAGTPDALAQALRARSASSLASLFIFDNFETIADARELHAFLDEYTTVPNEILITSRERAFPVDYPIEVRGMELKEAIELLTRAARDLGIEALVTREVVEQVWRQTDGNAYIMRVVLGEIAKEGRYQPPKMVLTRRRNIEDAVFERSFDKLTDAGRWVFLTVANWRSAVFELPLLAVLGEKDIDVESGLMECTRLSLIQRDETFDGRPCYSAPELARLFGARKLEGDPDRLAIQECLDTLHRFGAVARAGRDRAPEEEQIGRFLSWVTSDAGHLNVEEIRRRYRILMQIAELWPKGWSELAKFRRVNRFPRREVEYALRRSVEENPSSRVAWLARAQYAAEVHDEGTKISALVSAVNADPGDLILASEVAGELTRYISSHKDEIPVTRRGVYLASVRGHLEGRVGELNATQLSRLAWLFFLENDSDRAAEYVRRGLEQDSRNEYCLKLAYRLRETDDLTPRKGKIPKRDA